MFTDGITREYERIMRRPPNYQTSGSGKRAMQFRYTFADIDCEFCLNNQKKRRGCGLKVCPYIMDNLDDLIDDLDFINAVKNAELCKTKQKETLLIIKKRANILNPTQEIDSEYAHSIRKVCL